VNFWEDNKLVRGERVVVRGITVICKGVMIEIGVMDDYEWELESRESFLTWGSIALIIFASLLCFIFSCFLFLIWPLIQNVSVPKFQYLENNNIFTWKKYESHNTNNWTANMDTSHRIRQLLWTKNLPLEAFYGTLHQVVHQEYFRTQSFHHEKPTPPHQSWISIKIISCATTEI